MVTHWWLFFRLRYVRLSARSQSDLGHYTELGNDDTLEDRETFQNYGERRKEVHIESFYRSVWYKGTTATCTKV
jgi:hypothetical protein